MREIGVRQLKASLSETLREVSRGRHVRVTSRGRVIAEIVPAAASADDDRIRELVAAGRVASPTRPRPGRAPRMARVTDSASAAVLADREAER